MKSHQMKRRWLSLSFLTAALMTAAPSAWAGGAYAYADNIYFNGNRCYVRANINDTDRAGYITYSTKSVCTGGALHSTYADLFLGTGLDRKAGAVATCSTGGQLTCYARGQYLDPAYTQTWCVLSMTYYNGSQGNKASVKVCFST